MDAIDTLKNISVNQYADETAKGKEAAKLNQLISDAALAATTETEDAKATFEAYMMATGEMATDVGTILYGKEAVASGLIDKLGGLNDALSCLHKMIEENRSKRES